MIDIQTDETREGWLFTVVISESESETRHRVTLKRADYDRLTRGRCAAETLARKSFEFLLQREPKEAILREFDLTVIGRYFPRFESEIQSSLGGSPPP